MPDALVDTDVLVDHLRGARRLQVGSRELVYSVITRAELFAGQRGEPEVRALLDSMTEQEIDREIAEAGGRLRRVHPLTIADALIAATALKLGAPLLTRNKRPFRGIHGLRVESPRD